MQPNHRSTLDFTGLWWNVSDSLSPRFLPPLLTETTRYDRSGRKTAMKSTPASPCQRGGRRFEPGLVSLAQRVELAFNIEDQVLHASVCLLEEPADRPRFPGAAVCLDQRARDDETVDVDVERLAVRGLADRGIHSARISPASRENAPIGADAKIKRSKCVVSLDCVPSKHAPLC